MTDFFPRGSVIRRVNGEPAILFGAGRALLLQLAHPVIASGVRDHSDFRRNPFTRLQGTLEAVNAAVYGSEDLALAVGRRIQWVHDFIVGPEYRANDPDNLLWVHATLTDTALRCYTTLVDRLTPDDEETYYQEMTRVAELFGVPRSAQPGSLAAFRAYVDETVSGLTVSDAGRELGRFVVDPTLPLRGEVPLAPVIELQRLHAVGTLPASLREQFGFRWSDRRQRRLERSQRLIRGVSTVTPRQLRQAPGSLHGRIQLVQASRNIRQWQADLAASCP